MSSDDDLVFKALADPTRRLFLDRLRERNGQTLGELCDGLEMSRQSATQHLDGLVTANLISTHRDGRERRHYLNPVPIHEIGERWIQQFEVPRLRTIAGIKQRSEASMNQNKTRSDSTTDVPGFSYVTYIHATPEAVWEALTSADLTASYWGRAQTSDWKVGSRWDHVRVDGSGISDCGGNIVISDRPRRLAMTWAGNAEGDAISNVTFDIEAHQGIVRLTVTHTDLPSVGDRADIAHGWPAVLANLKSLLETGSVLPVAPWTMAANA